jgi:diaminopimelate decarboxylase
MARPEVRSNSVSTLDRRTRASHHPPLAMTLDTALLHTLAEKVGTPFWLYDAGAIRKRIADVRFLTNTEGLQPRYAMKACSAAKVLGEMKQHGIWIDAVSGNEVLRALRAGHTAGNEPPVICFTADVFRDDALKVILEHQVLPNLGSPGMITQLAGTGYSGPVSLRVNPGFGHGHVNACDTGGPSSKHGIWLDDLEAAADAAERAGMRVTMLHAHIGSGAEFQELCDNLARLTTEFVDLIPRFSHAAGVSLGGGIPHNYRDPHADIPLEALRNLFAECREKLCAAARRPLRLEIEPGRYYVAPGCALITRVADIKTTRTNEKGRGAKFAMVDAGFVDLVRPAMYGSFHRIELVGTPDPTGPLEEYVVAGPLCESGDIFTQDDAESLVPRSLPTLEPGDLLALRDAGAYGYTMSSNYNSIGRAPQLWLEEDGTVAMISRRETMDDLVDLEMELPVMPDPARRRVGF